MKKLTYLLFCLFLGIGMATAQTTKVTGSVISADDNEPIIGASIMVKGTMVGTVTDFNGAFSLNVPSSAKTLVVSYVGMKTQEVTVKSNLKILMESDNQMIDEVMVVAYGTAKRSAFTGSAATIKNEKIAVRQTSNVTNALAGQVAGVQITSNSGQPGKDATVRIRGIGSISASNTPLYVVDGVPYDGEISSINSQDIESMTVLKDAASNSLYGARGANGVILITTKSGKSGDARISFDAKWGTNRRGVPAYSVVTDPGKFYELNYAAIYNADMEGYLANGDLTAANAYANQQMLTSEYLGYQVYSVPTGGQLIGMDGKLNPNATLGYSDGTYTYTPDDWYKEIFKSNNLRQEYNLSISGAGDKMNYYMSAGYLSDEGIVPNSGFKRYSTRLKADYQVKKWLKIGANISYVHYDSREPREMDASTSNGNIFYATNIVGPIYPLYVRDASGNIMKDARGLTTYDYGSNTNFSREGVIPNANPAGDYALDKRQYLGDVVSGKWFAHIDIWDGLKAQVNIGVDANNNRYTNLYNAYYGQYSETSGVGGIIYVGSNRTFSTNQQYLLTYNKTFNTLHNVDFLAGFESYNLKDQNVQGSREKLYNPEVPELNNGILNQQASSSTDNYATQGFLFRAQYDYDGKYFGSVSYRRDASSSFDPDNRWGNFWSVGAGWLMNRESFLVDKEWINILKFKISYGVQGNDKLMYQGGVYRNYYPYQDQFTIKNNNGDFSTGLYYKGNRDITWESSHSFNTGFDFTFWNGKLSGSAEYFSRKTTDMLYFKPVSPSLGYSRLPMNVGSMANRGVELDLNSMLIDTKDVSLNINFNLTHFKNKVLELDPSLNGEMIDGSRIYREGESMYQFYIPKYAGVNKETGESQWYLNEPDEEGNTVTTNYSIATSNRQSTGDILPKVYGGFGASLTVHGFDLSVALAYQLGGRIMDYTYQEMVKPQAKGANLHEDMLNAWTPENRDTNIPRLNVMDTYANATSDRFLTSSDYLSLQNITFGYTLPKNITRKFQVEGLRFYFVADNVALIAARKGIDPRQSYTGADNVYSPIRTFSGGVSLTF